MINTKLFGIILALLSASVSANNSTVTASDPFPENVISYFSNNAAQSTETHVIGVYETRSDHSANYRPEGAAFIYISGLASTPVNLVLSSYEPTRWILLGTGVSFIEKVLINGYYESRVFGVDSEKIIDKTGIGNYFSACGYSFPDNPGGCNTSSLIQGVESYFGTEISTFTGSYRMNNFSLTLAPVPELSTSGFLMLGLSALMIHLRRKTI